MGLKVSLINSSNNLNHGFIKPIKAKISIVENVAWKSQFTFYKRLVLIRKKKQNFLIFKRRGILPKSQFAALPSFEPSTKGTGSPVGIRIDLFFSCGAWGGWDAVSNSGGCSLGEALALQHAPGQVRIMAIVFDYLMKGSAFSYSISPLPPTSFAPRR